MTTPTQPSAAPTRRVRRNIARRLARAALFAAVRGVAYAAGATTVTVIIWWISNR
ncbi:hypothetical protein [Nonomuraea sp. NPDC046570]|uniref:hypothetical protein n=1 Tax=Nonomuraea sp. NPDC046570 TaxID=3155255 RepID=UPI0033FB9758